MIPERWPARRGFIGPWPESPRSFHSSRMPFMSRQIVFSFGLLFIGLRRLYPVLTGEKLQVIWGRRKSSPKKFFNHRWTQINTDLKSEG
jgi:hypothetical protein